MIAPYQNPEAEKGLLRRPFHRARLYLADAFLERQKWTFGASSVQSASAWGFAIWVALASVFYLGAMLGWW